VPRWVVASSAASFSGPGGARDRADVVPLTGENRILVRHGLKLLAGRIGPGWGAGRNGGPRGESRSSRVTSGSSWRRVSMRRPDRGRERRAAAAPVRRSGRGAAIAREPRGRSTPGARRWTSASSTTRSSCRAVLVPEDRALVLAATLHPGDRDRGLPVVRALWAATFLIAWGRGERAGRGSGRSVAGFDLHPRCHRVGHHLEKYGGHTMAAGITIRRGSLRAFRVAFSPSRVSLLSPDDLVPASGSTWSCRWVSGERGAGKASYLEPCRPGNPAPVFA